MIIFWERSLVEAILFVFNYKFLVKTGYFERRKTNENDI